MTRGGRWEKGGWRREKEGEGRRDLEKGEGGSEFQEGNDNTNTERKLAHQQRLRHCMSTIINTHNNEP